MSIVEPNNQIQQQGRIEKDGLDINKFTDYSSCRKARSLQKVKIEVSSKIAEI